MAPKTFNRDDCHCGKNHDSLEHISRGVISLLIRGEISYADAPAALERAAMSVGWTHPSYFPITNTEI